MLYVDKEGIGHTASEKNSFENVDGLPTDAKCLFWLRQIENEYSGLMKSPTLQLLYRVGVLTWLTYNQVIFDTSNRRFDIYEMNSKLYDTIVWCCNIP